MAEDTTVQATQREAQDQSQRDTNQATNTNQSATQRDAGNQEQGAGEEGRTVSYASHMKLLNEKKTMQERLQAYLDAEEAQKPEAERTKKQLEAITKERDELARRVRFADAMQLAEKANARKASTVAKLLLDAEDMAAELASLKKDDPDLFVRTSIDAGAQGRGQQSTDFNDMIRTAALGRH